MSILWSDDAEDLAVMSTEYLSVVDAFVFKRAGDGYNGTAGIVSLVVGSVFRRTVINSAASFDISHRTTFALGDGEFLRLDHVFAPILTLNKSGTDLVAYGYRDAPTPVEIGRAVNALSGGTWQQIDCRGTLSTYTAGAYTASGSLTIFVEGTPVIAVFGTALLRPNDATSIWDSVRFSTLGNIDDIVIANTYLSGSPTAVPLPTALAPQTPCAPSPGVGNGGQGNAGCNTGGTGWVPQCTSPGGLAPSDADLVDGEDLTGKTGLETWIALTHTAYPSLVQTSYRWSFDHLADPSTYYGGRKDGRLMNLADIERSLSDQSGNFVGSSLSFDVSDTDRLVRQLLASALTKQFPKCPADVYCVSHEGRLAGVAPRKLGSFILSGAPAPAPYSVQFSGDDLLFSQFGTFAPDRKFPTWTLPATLFQTTPPASVGQPFPIYYGEQSDEGAVNPITNLVSPKGLVPLLYVGKESIVSTATSPTVAAYDTSIPAPTGAGVNNLVGGTLAQPLAFRVVPVVNGVWGTVSHLFVLDPDPAFAGTPHAAQVSWQDTANVVNTPGASYLVFMTDNMGFDPITNAAGTIVRQKTISGAWNVSPGDPNAPFANYTVTFTSTTDGTAYSGPTPTTTITTTNWDCYIVSLGAIKGVISLFGSDLGGGVPNQKPDRVKIDPSRFGTEFLIPGQTGWPYATPYRDYTDPISGQIYRLTVIYAQGPVSDDHKNGVVNMTVNLCGIEDQGDGSGNVIDQQFAAYEHWLINFVENNYSHGLWATTTVGSSGFAQIKTSSFTAAQAYTVRKIAGRGYLAGMVHDKQVGIRDAIQMWNDASGCRVGINHFGQIVCTVVDDTYDPSNAPKFVHESDTFGTVQFWLEDSERENIEVYAWDWDADQQTYRNPLTELRNAAAILANHGLEQRSKLLQLRLRHQPTVESLVMQRQLRLKNGPNYLEFTTDARGHGVDLGDVLRFSSTEYGFTLRPFMVVSHTVSAVTGLVTLKCLDLGEILPYSALPNGAAQTFLLGDETIPAGSAGAAPVLGDETKGTAMVLR